MKNTDKKIRKHERDYYNYKFFINCRNLNFDLRKVGRIIVVLIILFINFSLKQFEISKNEIANANIDGGFIIVLLIGLSYGGYKLVINENAQ